MPDAKLILTAVLAVGLVAALVGPAPSAHRPFETVFLALAAVAAYLVALVVGVTVDGDVGTACAAPGIVAFCLSTWLSRGHEHHDDDGGHDDEPDPDPPVDWDAFDRARHAWGRCGPRTPVAVD